MQIKAVSAAGSVAAPAPPPGPPLFVPASRAAPCWGGDDEEDDDDGEASLLALPDVRPSIFYVARTAGLASQAGGGSPCSPGVEE